MKGVSGDFWVLTIILEFANIRHLLKGEVGNSTIERRDLTEDIESIRDVKLISGGELKWSEKLP